MKLSRPAAYASAQIHSHEAMRHEAPRFTGESRCPRQKWIPAFAGKARRGVNWLIWMILSTRQQSCRRFVPLFNIDRLAPVQKGSMRHLSWWRVRSAPSGGGLPLRYLYR